MGEAMFRYILICFILLVSASTVFASGNKTGRLSGSWIPSKIGPIANGLIYVFNADSGPPPQTDRYFRRAPDVLDKTDIKGKFSIELPEGSYYLSVQKKTEGDVAGPPKDGDLSGVIRNKKGDPIKYSVKNGKTTNIGVLRSASVYKSPVIKTTKGMTAITGVIKSMSGSPLTGARAMVHDNPEMRGKPSYISNNTGRDGKYLVQVDQEGIYYVDIRIANSGGRPKNGDTVGVYGGEIAQPVEVRKENVTSGIDIQASQFVNKRPE